MKLKLQPENPLEWMALKMNLAPLPLVETQIYFTVARAIMSAAELGIYESIGKTAKTSEEVAKDCRTNPVATKNLLNALVGIGYAKHSDGKYSLPSKMKKWLLKESDSNMIGKLRFQLLEWDWVGKMEEYVRTGKPLELHSSINPKEWEHYQEGMRDLSVNAAKELAKKIPLPSGATRLLDIGGSHGLYSIELCKKYPNLSSTILELAGAIDSASSIAKRYDQTGRVHYQAGNALTDDIGESKYDMVMINNVVHHFTEEQNIALAAKIYRALKSGGIYAVGEIIRNDQPGAGGVIAAASGLYFSLTSSSGNWSEPEISSWQTKAGFQKLKTVSAMTLPGWKMVIGKK
jgi:2-polyprenyl-3-methyl-5-hydroxy-6-metoxy-1,4-benzoquinol methylase